MKVSSYSDTCQWLKDEGTGEIGRCGPFTC
jgi:hypothetical protein